MEGAELTYFLITLIGFILAGGFWITAFILFFLLDIRDVIKNKGGTMEQKQIEEIRAKNAGAAQYRGKVNVFEDMEKRAKPKKSDTGRLRVGNTTGTSGDISASPSFANHGTTLLQQSAKAVNPDFIIEKNIMFVNTNEVI